MEEAKSGRIDAVGWGGVEYVNETQSAAVPGAGESIERKSLYDGYALCEDTNNNSEDLFVRDMPTPENSSFSMNPVPSSFPVNPMPPLSVPEFSLTGLLALIGITSIVLAVTVLASGRERTKTKSYLYRQREDECWGIIINKSGARRGRK